MANSKHDARHAAFVAIGLSVGSLADRSMIHLTNKGATTGTMADRQVFLGKKPDPTGTIDPTLYP